MAAFLKFLVGKSKGQEVRLPEEGQFLLGRGLRADLVVEDVLVSRIHSAVACGPEGFLIRDRESLNGTYVNEKRVHEAGLRDGDIIRVGRTRLEFRAEGKEAKQDAGATLLSKTLAGGFSVISATDDPQRAAKDLAIVYRVGNIIASERDLTVLCPVILEAVLEVLEAESAALLLADERTGKLQEVALRGATGGAAAYSHSIAEQCYSIGACVATSDALSDKRFSSAETVSEARIRAALCAPVQTNDAIIGTIYVDRRSTTAEFDLSDLELLSAIGKQAGIAIQNALLRVKEIERERLEHEIDIAASVQKGLFPRSAPDIPGYRIAGRSLPCMKVGGDYYDFIFLDESRMISVVADVAGHGLAPALLMAEVRATLRAKLGANRSLPDVLRELNRTLIENMSPEQFVTLFAVCLDLGPGNLLYVGAGHDPAVLVRPGQEELILLESKGPPLGIVEDAEFPVEEGGQLNPGDVMLLYTDGLWEAGSDKGNPLGKKTMFDLAQKIASAEVGDMLQQLMDAALRQAGGSPHDDVTAVVMKKI